MNIVETLIGLSPKGLESSLTYLRHQQIGKARCDGVHVHDDLAICRRGEWDLLDHDTCRAEVIVDTNSSHAGLPSGGSKSVTSLPPALIELGIFTPQPLMALDATWAGSYC